MFTPMINSLIGYIYFKIEFISWTHLQQWKIHNRIFTFFKNPMLEHLLKKKKSMKCLYQGKN